MFDGFRYKDHLLHSDGVNLAEVAEKYGTPTYVYISSNIEKSYQELEEALKPIPHIICYSVKANSNLSILRTLNQMGAGADIVSGGELFRALEAEIPADKIVFSGVGKTREEIDFAMKKKILCFNIESEQELVAIDCIAKSHRKVASICIRVNPDVNPKTHPYIATGLKHSKFGIPYRQALELVRSTLRLKNVNLIGLACHIGSQITQVAPFMDSVRRMLKLYDQVQKLKPEVNILDLGGGLGVIYNNEKPPSIKHWAESLIKEIGDRKLTLILEPGRSIVGNAGILLTKVLYVKRGESDNFIVADAGMNDLIRPSLYGAYHSILPVHYRKYKKIKASVVGPCCESGDILTKARRIQNFQPGDLLAVMSCGAYGASMSSHYNSRPKAAEVLIREQKHYLIRERETFEDLVGKEKTPPFLKKVATAS
ncbi:MAG: diaminopimelate decarboxylase [Deltaproteobacteria bacterium]|nr:diaminopimelate decarboxylase [Deltaproteobacteria bacterium]